MILCVGYCVEKLNIVSKDYGCILKCDISVLNWKYPLCSNMVQKIKNVTLNWHLVLGLIQICTIQ